MEIEMKDITCANCGIVFAITSVHDSNLRKCHNTFCCPSGHPQSYTGKTEEERLREVLKGKEETIAYFRRIEAERSAEYKKKFEAKLKKQKAARLAKKKLAKKA